MSSHPCKCCTSTCTASASSPLYNARHARCIWAYGYNHAIHYMLSQADISMYVHTHTYPVHTWASSLLLGTPESTARSNALRNHISASWMTSSPAPAPSLCWTRPCAQSASPRFSAARALLTPVNASMLHRHCLVCDRCSMEICYGMVSETVPSSRS